MAAARNGYTIERSQPSSDSTTCPTKKKKKTANASSVAVAYSCSHLLLTTTMATMIVVMLMTMTTTKVVHAFSVGHRTMKTLSPPCRDGSGCVTPSRYGLPSSSASIPSPMRSQRQLSNVQTFTSATFLAASSPSSSSGSSSSSSSSSSSAAATAASSSSTSSRSRGRKLRDIFLPHHHNDDDDDGTSSPSSSSEQRVRQEERDELLMFQLLEDADVLLAGADKVKAKALVHERDYFRQATRVQAWDEYVLVSVLCTSISYGALQTFALDPAHEGIVLYELYVETAVHITAGIAVLTGLYSTMVFSLSILYARTALGMERDPQYDSFLRNTEQIRVNAFRSFSASLFSFAILVVLVLSEDLPLVMHLPVGGAMLFALFLGIRDWKIIVDEASDIYDFID